MVSDVTLTRTFSVMRFDWRCELRGEKALGTNGSVICCRSLDLLGLFEFLSQLFGVWISRGTHTFRIHINTYSIKDAEHIT